MSILNKMKRAFGFGGEDIDDEDQLYADTAVDIESPDTAAAPTPRPKEGNEEPIPDFVVDAARRDMIFSHVVEEFNKALPDFISKSVDPEAQRKFLLEKLDQGLKDYLDSLSQLAQLHSESMWKERQTELSSQLDSVKLRAEEIERQAAEVKQKQLSADRQKRALTDRTHDLEAQLARSESEREQFELENRSLVNRLKVAGIMQEDVDKLREENKNLRIELLKATYPGEEIGEAEAADSSLFLGAEAKEAYESRITDLESKARDMESRNEVLQGQLAQMKATLDETNTTLDEYRHIVENLDKLEATLTRQEEKIKKQQQALDKRDAEIKELKEELEAEKLQSRKTETALREQLSELRSPAVTDRMEINFGTVSESSAPRISEDDLSAMEESFENGDWFTQTPPAETPSMRPAEADPEFGYKAPRRKSSPQVNPNQLSLF